MYLFYNENGQTSISEHKYRVIVLINMCSKISKSFSLDAMYHHYIIFQVPGGTLYNFTVHLNDWRCIPSVVSVASLHRDPCANIPGFDLMVRVLASIFCLNYKTNLGLSLIKLKL